MNNKKYKDLVSKGVISDKVDRYDAVEILANIKDMKDIVKRSKQKKWRNLQKRQRTCLW